MATREEFGMNFEQLKVYLAEQGLTQKELADRLGTVPRTVSRWKKVGIPKKHHDKILGILNIENLELEETHDAVTLFKNLTKPPLKRVSAKITFSAANSYLFIEEEYGITRKSLIEMAPLLLNCIAADGLSRLKKEIVKEEDLINKLPKGWGPNARIQLQYEKKQKAVKEENFFKYGHFDKYISVCMHKYKNCGFDKYFSWFYKESKNSEYAFKYFDLKLFDLIGMFGKIAFPEKLLKHFFKSKVLADGDTSLFHVLDFSKVRNSDGSFDKSRVETEVKKLKINLDTKVLEI